MKTSPSAILATTILWAGTLIGAYQLGHRNTAASGADTTSSATMQAGVFDDESPVPARGHKRGTENTLSVKQIFTQIKAIMRPGAMQNPAVRFHIPALLDQLHPEEIGDALNEAEKLKDPQSEIVSMVLIKWAENDGPAAMKYAEEHSKGGGRSGSTLKMSVTSAWAKSDPYAVLQWYNDNKENDSGGSYGGNQTALTAVFSNLMSTNPDAAFKRLEELDPKARWCAFRGMCQSALMDDDKRQLLLDNINTMADEAEKATSRRMLLYQWVNSSPEDPSAWVAKLPAADQKSLRENMGPSLLRTDPKKGAAFMMEGASEEDKPYRYSRVVGEWSEWDTIAAAAWLDSQGNGPELDQARQTLVSQMSKKNPANAMSKAQSITDADKRFSAISTAYGAWSKKDSSSADQALQNAGLTAEQVKSIRSSQQ